MNIRMVIGMIIRLAIGALGMISGCFFLPEHHGFFFAGIVKNL